MSRRQLTRDLILALADNCGLPAPTVDHLRRKTTRRAPDDATRAEWSSHLSALLLVRCLQHKVECTLDDCPDCDAIYWRLEEPDLLRARQAAHEMERLTEVERRARAFIDALDARGPARGHRAAVSARLLRAALRIPVHNTEVDKEVPLSGSSKHSLQTRLEVGRASEGLRRPEVEELAAAHGVGATTVYKWRKLARAHDRADEHGSEEGGQTVAVLQRRTRQLESAISDLMIENLSLRRQLDPTAG